MIGLVIFLASCGRSEESAAPSVVAPTTVPEANTTETDQGCNRTDGHQASRRATPTKSARRGFSNQVRFESAASPSSTALGAASPTKSALGRGFSSAIGGRRESNQRDGFRRSQPD